MTRKQESRRVEKNWLEWLVFAVSLLIVLGVVGYLGIAGLTADDSPPDVVVELGPPEPAAVGFRVPVRVVNRGGRTAEDVVVTIASEVEGGPPETADLSVAFLPRGSERVGWAAFTGDARAASVRAVAIAYEAP